MKKKIWYPTVKRIIANNKIVLGIYKATKGDSHKVIGKYKLKPIIDESKRYGDNIEEKAAILLRGVNRAHSFASANKRTAFFTANQFVKKNKNYWILKKRDKQRDFAIKVREGRVSDKEIAEWLN